MYLCSHRDFSLCSILRNYAQRERLAGTSLNALSRLEGWVDSGASNLIEIEMSTDVE